MAKMNKLERARQDGIEFAYRLVKEKGMEALEARVRRNQLTAVPAFVSEAQRIEFEHYVKTNCIVSFISIISMIGRDRLGYGKKRMSRLIGWFNYYADSVNARYLSYNDCAQAIDDETGINIKDYWVGSERAVAEIERTLRQEEERRC